MARTRNKVVLFYPAYESEENAPPLALTAIAGPLVSDGVEVVIIDSALEPDPVAATLAHLDDALCLGVSFITGSMIADLIAVCAPLRVSNLILQQLAERRPAGYYPNDPAVHQVVIDVYRARILDPASNTQASAPGARATTAVP